MKVIIQKTDSQPIGYKTALKCKLKILHTALILYSKLPFCSKAKQYCISNICITQALHVDLNFQKIKTNTMGLFDFFKSKKQGIDHAKFNSDQFQNEACALALWKLKDHNMQPGIAISELKKIGLNDEQANFILEKVKRFIAQETNTNHPKPEEPGIDDIKFRSDAYQNEILTYAQNVYFQNHHQYGTVKDILLKDGLNTSQADEIINKLQERNAQMVNEFQEKLDSGEITEIKIKPNPDHTKENTGQDQVDRYIAYGAYQMDRGDLDNALELFEKAIELDENATLAYANLGKLYSLKNDNLKALGFINKALETEPSHPQILDNKVDVAYELLMENKISESGFIANIKDVLQKDPDNPALIYMIQFYLRNNQIDHAVESVEKLFPKYYSEDITIQLMVDTFNRLSPEQALKQFDILESKVSEEARYQLHYNKGLYLKGIGRYDDAIRVYDNLNKIQEFSWSFYQMGIMKNLQGKTDESLELLKKTFHLEPGLKEDAKNFPQLRNLWTHPEFIEMTK